MKKISFLLAFTILPSIIIGNYWTQKASFPSTPRMGPYSFSIGTKGYLGGGYSGSGACSDFWQYDKLLNTWTQLSSPLGPRSEATGFSAGGFGFAGMGHNFNTGMNDFYKFDPSTNTWTTSTPFPSIIVGAKGISADSLGFVYGGYQFNPAGPGSVQFYNYFTKFDPISEVWTALTPCTSPWRSQLVAFGINNKILIGIGENASGAPNNELWEYDILTDIWIQKIDMPLPYREGASGFIIDTLCYVSLGKISTTYHSTCYKYNLNNNQWTTFSNFQGMGRYFGVEFSLSNTGFVGLGGRGNSVFYTDFWEYSASPSTGLSDQERLTIKIFPNPTKEYAEFIMPLNFPNMNVKVFDSSGKCIRYIDKVDTKKCRIDCSKLNSGLYNIMLYDHNRLIASEKLFVIK